MICTRWELFGSSLLNVNLLAVLKFPSGSWTDQIQTSQLLFLPAGRDQDNWKLQRLQTPTCRLLASVQTRFCSSSGRRRETGGDCQTGPLMHRCASKGGAEPF